MPAESGYALPEAVQADLNAFDPAKRKAALAVAVRDGRSHWPQPANISNIHCHTFYSYCCMDLSPYGLVWEAGRRGLAVVGSTDFDVLNAMDEMFEAGDALGMRTTVSLETRVFSEAYADREVSSPGEPGVMYMMGIGFTKLPAANSIFPTLAAQSRARNLEMVAKVNAVMGKAAIDYDRDVLPLTPAGNATERHLCAAYDNKARAAFANESDLAAFWAGVLGLDAAKARSLIGDAGGLRNAIRAKLMKKGGVGYSQPGKGSFPKVEDFFAMVRDARAVPCLAWLDGTSAGEADPGRLIDDAMSWGARAVNIIPDRNWNIADPAAKTKKMAALAAFVGEARKRALPIVAGTELNGPGQKFVDSFDAPELAPYVADFMDGAYWLYGHTVMERFEGKGAMSPWAEEKFGGDRAAANAFYAQTGRETRPGKGDNHGNI
ncbi:MAG: hypothetical protein LBS30_04650 [Planctomycetota bacterium]|jgi:hypothetical protein|nr:hypothetical protein [Planctomycetota bacterium]